MPGPDELVEFELNEIKLDIPLEGMTLEGGWKITPLTVPVVRDYFWTFHVYLPYCMHMYFR